MDGISPEGMRNVARMHAAMAKDVFDLADAVEQGRDADALEIKKRLIALSMVFLKVSDCLTNPDGGR